MRLEQGMTARQRKRLKKSSSESGGKKPSWIEYSPVLGLTKDIGKRAITNNNGNVGKVHSSVQKANGTF